MTILNQIINMASQLRQDIHLSNHKYMAHQLALLYQCLAHAGTEAAKFRQRIEKQFDTIKSATSGADAPQLSPSHKQWYHATSNVLAMPNLLG